MAQVVIKEFEVPCITNGQSSTVTVYMGNPEREHNPIAHQANFLAKERGIVISAEIMTTLDKLKSIALENGVPFIELCEYALKSLKASGTVQIENSAQRGVAAQNNTALQGKVDVQELTAQNTVQDLVKNEEGTSGSIAPNPYKDSKDETKVSETTTR